MGYNPRQRPEMAENTSFADPPRVMYRGSQGIETSWDSKIMGYNLRNEQKWPKTRVLPIPQESCTGDQGHRNPPGTRKSWVITHENGQKWPKTRVYSIPLESCIGGHRASKSSWDSKIMGSNPRKRPEIAENTSFADLSRVVYRESEGIEILPGLENHGL